jgi:hypothetical protein
VLLISASYRPIKVVNFAGVADTGNASFTSINDTGDACIAGVIDIGDATVKLLPVRKCF